MAAHKFELGIPHGQDAEAQLVEPGDGAVALREQLFLADRPFDADLLGHMYGDALAIPQRRADRQQDDDTSTEQRGNGCVAKVRDQDGADGADRNRKTRVVAGGRAASVAPELEIGVRSSMPSSPCVNA